jgi:hypothetical protein
VALFRSAARKVPRPAPRQPPRPAASTPPTPAAVGAPLSTPSEPANPAAVGVPLAAPTDPTAPFSRGAPVSGPQPSSSQDASGEVPPDYDDEDLDIPLTEEDEAAQSAVSGDEVRIGLPATPSLAPPMLQSVAPLYTPTWTAERVVIAVAFCAILALVVALGVVTMKTEPGSLTVTVLDPVGGNLENAVVAVDGEKRCTRSPCVVSGLSEGKHAVKVSAAGFEQLTEQETVLQPRLRTHLAIRLVGNPATARTGTVASAAPVEPAPPNSAASAEPADSAAPLEGSAEAVAAAAPVTAAAAAPKSVTASKAWASLKASKATSTTASTSTKKKKKKKKKTKSKPKKKVRRIKLQ